MSKTIYGTKVESMMYDPLWLSAFCRQYTTGYSLGRSAGLRRRAGCLSLKREKARGDGVWRLQQSVEV